MLNPIVMKEEEIEEHEKYEYLDAVIAETNKFYLYIRK